MPVRTALALVFTCLMLPSFARAEDVAATPLKQGDVVLFLGDSITAEGAHSKGFIPLIQKNFDEDHKDLKLKTIGAGVSGNKVPNLQARVEKDVVAKKPTIVFIYIGINDVWHGEKDPAKGTSKDKFESGLNEVIDKITAGGARVILCTPTVIGEKKDGGNALDKQLDEYADISRGIAAKRKLQLCDLRKAFADYLKTHNEKNEEKGVLTRDRVHLTEAGNKLIAETMLKTLSP